MKNWKIRVLALVLAMLMVIPMLAACDNGDETPEQPEQPGPVEEQTAEKEIDIYLIAGQSNAAGTTKIEDAAALRADYPALVNGTGPYILYAGNSAGNSPDNNVTHAWGNVKLGLGSSSSNIGPEVGMAKALSEYYSVA